MVVPNYIDSTSFSIKDLKILQIGLNIIVSDNKC